MDKVLLADWPIGGELMKGQVLSPNSEVHH